MTNDKERIHELLCGRIVHGGRGRPRRVDYLKEGSADELEARRALARVLKTSRPLNPGLRFVLGDLIDPDLDDVDRKIRFVHRRKGKRSNAIGEKEIAEFIWSRLRAGERMKAAQYSAEEQFGVKRSRVLAIWKTWQPILERLKRRDLKGNSIDPLEDFRPLIQHNRD